MTESPLEGSFQVMERIPRIFFHGGLIYRVRGRASRCLPYIPFGGRRAVRDAIQAVGIPSVEVDGILVNRRFWGSFSYILQEGNLLDVYPPGVPVPPVTPRIHLVPKAEGECRFVADGHLGTLSRRLRMLGLDVRYSPHAADAHLAYISAGEGRILLTRDRQLLMRREVRRGQLIGSTVPDRQALEVIRRFDLGRQLDPLVRCIRCNATLRTLSGEDLASSRWGERIPCRARRRYSRFRGCPRCLQVYWPGSHYPKLLKKIISFLENS